ncbi:FERM and PDZ domain-containing protein 1 isoform X1 [Elephas maximus indicus]|uniref:FERM and PDZ domain-containing protein 1 isoform X1 n=1 Tax=Elephas maximus indicus TaxID=99487 RepID=UPI002116637A|nr:FERM and PDZ domain-containing protein 1 isoform X1 [Elephas maximus indicus]XP_049751752.1 FERM and PDZ domain-containing protein 1 isoform X1 [Elephas maximus indicus]XP_049751754.1 FERM and PDZ domain-containing protein 1 isoform X1 [Elephas maximus indicus]XP_049751755.1 FERM and PDZ domain-containing protein 1 isoform X1 [Elephas maximus indicus]XP_049751756.1 FERM and PDZ domain-containing protein 1 isoform X1 [Elephas maximus indicus]XP_049751757.1 FERM and PDZ domain-containing prot
MEELESNLFQTRKAHRIEQMVARWLRRSRDSSARAKVAAADVSPGNPTQTLTPVRHTVKIDKDALLQDYGFHISESLPLTVVAVTAGGTAHGKLFPGDQILQMNNEPAEDLSCERAVDILREAEDSVSITVVRCTSGVPKSSFLTEEKRARLKTNPVKVHFAEEVLISGHGQGNSLLCMPNVLKLYLENGQTKAFKFDANTTVKDIILTVKEKLSIRSIEYFALALEEQYSVSRLHLLHEEELIQQVVEREESHDYRCLFRMCFVPKDPLDLLKEDPVAFEYLYLQSCSDVLQERFAVEMKCSSALRLAALHIQERIYACAQPQKISLKYIEKDWGIENFISPTLLRNMKGKDIKKAISFHMKRNQNLLEPRQKQLISAAQLRLNYLQILGELKTYGGKIFNATLMLQDRESYIALLVGAKYGISQIINSKLNIMSTLTEFANISRIELMEESEKVSMVKVYLQDIKVLTLLLESNSAKDLACLIAGYYRLFVDPVTSIFIWPGNKQQVHRVSAEEGYESRACSDSEESSEVDCVLEPLSDRCLVKLVPCTPLMQEEEQEPPGDSAVPEVARRGPSICGASSVTDSAESEASDSANTESRGCRTSGSSESMDALEEDDLDACSSSRSDFFHFDSSGFPKSLDSDSQEERSRIETSDFLYLLDLAQRASPQCQKTDFSESTAPEMFSWGPELSAVRLDPRLYEGSRADYYSLCSSVSSASHLSDSSESTASRQGCPPLAWGQQGWPEAQPSSTLEALALHPTLAFEDGSSDEEYYDAADKLTPPDTLSGPRAVSALEPSATSLQRKAGACNPEDSLNPGPHGPEPNRRGGVKKYAKTLRKRRSFLQTDYTSQVSFPLLPSASLESVDNVCYYDREPYLALGVPSPTVSSLQDMQGEPGLLETKALGLLAPLMEAKSKNPASRVMEMEPETMETKSVIDSRVSSISAIRLRVDPNHKENSGVAPLTVPVTSSPASTPQCSNPGSSGPDTAQAGPSQTLPPCQDPNGTAPKEVTMEPGDSTSLFSADPTPDGVCLAINSGPHNVSQGDTLELGAVQMETGLGSLFINHMQETTPKYTEPWLSPGDQPRSAECGINSGEKMASFPTKEEQQGQISLESDRKVTNKNDTNLFQEDSGKDSGDPSGDLSDAVSQALGVKGPAGEVIAYLSLEAAVTGTEQTPAHPARAPQGQSRETPGQACQTQEQKLLAGLDLDTDFLLGDQATPSALPPEGVKAELLNCVRGEDTAPADTVPQVCFNPGPFLTNLPLCPQEEPGLENSNTCSPSESKGKSICPPARKSLLCFASGNHPGVSARPGMTTSLGFAGINDAVAPRIGMEQCSCQFSYATCFRGPQPEMEEEDRDSEAHSKAPLTSPPSAGSPLALPWRPARAHSCSTEPLWRKSHIWPEYCSRALRQLKAAPTNTPEGFIQLTESLLELQDILEASWGDGKKHPPEKCTWHFSESRSRLCMGSQKLLSSCQHVIRTDQSPEEMQGAVHDTFQHLVQLAGLCFQLTDCSRCSARHREAAGNLRDVVYTYCQFVEAAKLTCERGYHDLSVKLLARQCTALTASVFCLTHKFRASTAL